MQSLYLFTYKQFAEKLNRFLTPHNCEPRLKPYISKELLHKISTNSFFIN